MSFAQECHVAVASVATANELLVAGFRVHSRMQVPGGAQTMAPFCACFCKTNSYPRSVPRRRPSGLCATRHVGYISCLLLRESLAGLIMFHW